MPIDWIEDEHGNSIATVGYGECAAIAERDGWFLVYDKNNHCYCKVNSIFIRIVHYK